MKNWIVTIEQKRRSGGVSERTERRNKAKGLETKKTKKKTLESAIKYLLNDKHNNHKDSIITDLGNARLVRDNIFNQYEDMKEESGKGLSNIASSFVLSIPSDLYHPSVDEWREISNTTMKNFVSGMNKELEKLEKANEKKDITKMTERQLKEYYLNIDRYSQRLDLDDVKDLSTSVIHDDRNKPLIVGKTSGSHLNIIMSNIQNKEVIKLISQKGGIKIMKQSYDQAVKSAIGLDCKKYIPYSSRPEDNKLFNFYDGDLSHLDLVEINENTPHKNKLIKNDNEEFKNKHHWETVQEKSILLQQEYDEVEKQKSIVEEENKKLNETKKKNIKIVKAGRKEKKDLKVEEIKIKKLREKTKNELKNGKIIKSELKEFLKNVLDDNLLKTFWTGIIGRCKRNNFSLNETLNVYEKEKETLKSFQDSVLDNLEKLEPGAIKLHQEKVKKEALRKAEKKAKRHEGAVFKSEDEIKAEIKKQAENIEPPKEKIKKESIWKKWGLIQ